MIEIITPVSHLLKDEQFKKVLYKKTDYLEAREHTENLTYNIKNKIKLFHFDTDINFKWDSILKKKIINLIQNKKKLKFIQQVKIVKEQLLKITIMFQKVDL